MLKTLILLKNKGRYRGSSFVMQNPVSHWLRFDCGSQGTKEIKTTVFIPWVPEPHSLY